MLFCRYGPATFTILEMPFEKGFKMVEAAAEADKRERLWQMWIAVLPNMREENYISFDLFCQRMTGADIDKRPIEEIIAEAKEAERRLKNGS